LRTIGLPRQWAYKLKDAATKGVKCSLQLADDYNGQDIRIDGDRIQRRIMRFAAESL